MKLPPMEFLGIFSMSFHIIFFAYSEKKNQLVTNSCNVYHVIPPSGPGLLRHHTDTSSNQD